MLTAVYDLRIYYATYYVRSVLSSALRPDLFSASLHIVQNSSQITRPHLLIQQD